LSKPTILLTNDDGIEASGLWAAHTALSTIASRVIVVAPDRNQSASSHSLTLEEPLQVRTHSLDAFAASGTPTDCVLLGARSIMKSKPHAVVAGINHGPNLGEDVLYSGTVAAALEGTILGVPSMAVSLTDPSAGSFEAAARVAAQLMNGELPLGTLLNVNVPGLPYEEIRGVRAARLGKRVYGDAVTEGTRNGDLLSYVIGGARLMWLPGKGTDFEAIHEGYVAVTPLRYELTDTRSLRRLQGVLRKTRILEARGGSR
jgi:5'-nucleotidase